MTHFRLKITLESDTTFGRGDGVAGLVDAEVQHDAYGLPYLGGRALKGLLGAECSDILLALERMPGQDLDRWRAAEQRLFGRSGSAGHGQAVMQVSPARLPADLRQALARDIYHRRLTRAEVLETVTALRRQTAVNPETGAPQKETLRTMRVILRGTVFEAPLTFSCEPGADDLALLAACVKAWRRAGTSRNRGRGRLRAELLDDQGRPVTSEYFGEFRKAVQP